MPKVSEAYREARRDEIARAAIQRLSKQGFSGTSMSDIIDESGMSAGAIYSHFASKAEIAQHVARMVVGTRAEELVAGERRDIAGQGEDEQQALQNVTPIPRSTAGPPVSSRAPSTSMNAPASRSVSTAQNGPASRAQPRAPSSPHGLARSPEVPLAATRMRARDVASVETLTTACQQHSAWVAIYRTCAPLTCC